MTPTEITDTLARRHADETIALMVFGAFCVVGAAVGCALAWFVVDGFIEACKSERNK